ncbi:chromatin assembly factor 1 subunit B, partial [Caerostris darwini]
MKCQIPQISWHCRDPILSIDFQPGKHNVQRLASGGTDSHVLIWYVTYQENKSVKIECASDLYRHNKSVNVVRFSPNGEWLASGDDEGAIFLWELLNEHDTVDNMNGEEFVNKENWFSNKILRGHLEDIYDISWSSDGKFLVSASMDNTAIIWDMQKFQSIFICSDSKGFVQGVSYDPLNSYIATVSSDRALRIFNINTKKTVCKVQRAPWTVSTEKGKTRARLFYDDTLKSFFRRLTYTPDGELLIVPSGILERDEEKFQNTTYIFSRHAPNKPVLQLPTGDKYTVAVRCNPLLYKLRSSNKENDKENQPKPMIDLPYRMIFAVAAHDSVLLYDTEQLSPFAYVSNIHYTHLTDLSWSPDGKILVASSTDGYCSFLVFGEDELGELYEPPKEKETNLI